MVLQFPLSPQNAQTPSGRILNLNSEQKPSVRVETRHPVSMSTIVSTPSTTTIASLAWQISQTMGLGLWYPGSATDLSVLTSIPSSPPLGYMSQGEVGGVCYLPQFSFKEMLRHSQATCPQPSQQKHYPTAIVSVMMILTHHCPLWLFLFTFLPLPNSPGFPDVVCCGGLLFTTCNCVICSFKLTISFFPSDCVNLTWNPSLGLFSCSDLTLQAVATS